jgi:hypothetical protein
MEGVTTPFWFSHLELALPSPEHLIDQDLICEHDEWIEPAEETPAFETVS